MRAGEVQVGPPASTVEASLGRRLGHVAAGVVNGILIGLVNGWPGWEAVPFLTDETRSVLVPVNLSLIVALLVSLVNAIFDRRWLKGVGEILTSAVSLAALVSVWCVFPFDFDDSDVDWDLITRTVLAFGMAACVVSIVVQSVLLTRLLLRRGHES